MRQRIVLDTNCLVVILPKHTPFRWLYDHILSGKIELVVTTEILFEYEELLSTFYSPEYADLITKVFINSPNVIKIQPISFNWQLIHLDADDNKFVDAYIAGNADILVSNDRHFQELKNVSFPEISVYKLEDLKID